ncbi:transmembrane protein 60 [Athalia rosae]|uniref:transmembrane protein 60 n=1 Tax=Athalia rosae TaxID=37344 RepID=UPI00062668FC|nr:transmembrane protein 60 [Athalia rosae]XP_012265070.1 transmembrane protein 60 [Athalia rosae]
MAVLHRALFTWFNLLIFLILLVLRLDLRIQWNWFIVFIPLWVYDNILLIYIVFNMISHCKNAHDRASSLRRKAWYMTAVLTKLSGQVLICLKLEAVQWGLPAKAVLAPFWLLLPALVCDVFAHLIQQSRY